MTRKDGTSSRSGPSGASTPRAARTRPRVELSLAPETVTLLDAIVAQGRYPSRSAAVDAAIDLLARDPWLDEPATPEQEAEGQRLARRQVR